MNGPPAAHTHDILGIGFGPSNLALAVALDEHNRGVGPTAAAGPPCGLDALFVEKQPTFGWHRGMLIEDATMQVSFLKDLATMRNPTSDYSFVAYLHEQGRLCDFVNHKTMFPLRLEYHDYLEWAAQRLGHLVEYGSEVVDVRPLSRAGTVWGFDVVVRRGSEVGIRRTRNLVIAAGLQRRMPSGVSTSERIWHNVDVLRRLDTLPADPPPSRFVVVGAGQSAAEVTLYLHGRFPEAEVCAVFSRYGYSPADDSPFANRIFDHAAVDLYFAAPRAVKQMLFDYHRNTNYSVVDLDLIDELYRRMYQEKVMGRERLRILNASRVIDVRADPASAHTTIEFMPTGERATVRADAVVFATGYRPFDVHELTGQAAELLVTDEEGMVRVQRDYRVVTTPGTQAGIYLQGSTEHTHGISSSLLSDIAVRAGEILESIILRREHTGGKRCLVTASEPT